MFKGCGAIYSPMPKETDLANDIKRHNYWTKEADYIPPKRIVRSPSETTVDDLLAYDLEAYVNYENRHRDN